MPSPFFFGDDDSSMADAGTAADLLKKKNTIPLFDSGSPTIPANTPVDFNSIPAPDVGQPAIENKFNLPWLPGYTPGQAQPTRPPGPSKAAKLDAILKSGIMGAIAGQASSEQAVMASGGHRGGGFGTGFEAALTAPLARQQMQQQVTRGGLENQQLEQQVKFYPQTAALGIGKTIADIQKSQAEAGKATAETGAIPVKTELERMQALSARFKEDPGSGALIDLQTQQPVSGGQMIPIQSQELAGVLNVPVGTQVPIQRAIKAADLLTKGITNVNTAQGVFERNRITGTNTRLGDNPREISLDTPVGALDNSTGKQVMVTRKDIIGNPGRYAPVSADVSTPVIKQTLKEYASTKPNTAGGQVVAFNTAILHLGLLSDAADALGNGNIKLFNSISQKWKEQTGSPLPSRFDTIKQMASGEITKVGGSLNQGEQEAVKGPLEKSNSPQALKGSIGASIQLMDGKISILHQHYVDIMHEEPDAPLIYPEAQKVRDRLLGGNQVGGQIQVKDPTGGVHTFADQASADRFKQLAGIR